MVKSHDGRRKTKAHRHRGTEAQRKDFVFLKTLCAFVPGTLGILP